MKKSNFNFQIKRLGEGKKKRKKSSFSFFIHSNSKYCVRALFGSTKKLELIVDLPRNLFPILDASRMFIPLLLIP